MKKRNLMTAGAAWLLALSLAACSAAAPQNTAPETAAETESAAAQTVSETESMTPETAAETESETETAESPETEESGTQTLPARTGPEAHHRSGGGEYHHFPGARDHTDPVRSWTC